MALMGGIEVVGVPHGLSRPDDHSEAATRMLDFLAAQLQDFLVSYREVRRRVWYDVRARACA